MTGNEPFCHCERSEAILCLLKIDKMGNICRMYYQN